jgi:CRISPR-associated exonuclease Cas4
MKWHNYSRSEKVKSIRRGTYLASKVLEVKVAYGIIHYPKLLKKLNVYLEDANNDKILNALNEISKTIKSEKIPNVINKLYCKKCSIRRFIF